MAVELSLHVINTRLQELYNIFCNHFANTVAPINEYSEGRQSFAMTYKDLEKELDFALIFSKDQVPLATMAVWENGIKVDVPLLFTSDAFALSWFINKVRHARGNSDRITLSEPIYCPPQYREIMIERLHM